MWLTMKAWARRALKVTLPPVPRARTGPVVADRFYLVCCIYHKPRPVGESSSESESSDSSSSDSDSDSEIDHRSDRTSRSRLAPDSADKLPQHSPDQSMQGGQETCCQAHRGVTRKERNPSPNAYEKLPKTTRRPTKIETSG